MNETDPIRLALWRHRFEAIAEQVLEALARSAFSPNIKERRDHSAAVFTGDGRMVAHAAAIPVHLGSQPLSVAAAIERFTGRWRPGDAILLNDPWGGGTHLPDLTVVSPVFAPDAEAGARPRWIVSTRAHHADIGGMSPGSLPLSSEVLQEGLRIPPLRIVQGGALDRDLVELVAANSRTPEERRGDLTAQLAANALGVLRLTELENDGLAGEMHTYAEALIAYAARMMRAVLGSVPDGVYRAEDVIDSDGRGNGPLPLRVEVQIAGERARVDFTGSAPACRGSLNANRAIVHAAVGYAFTALARAVHGAETDDPPANAGLLEPIEIVVPPGSILDPPFPRAVAGGNVETSERLVDVLLAALAEAAPEHVPAASHGSMNNLTIGAADGGSTRPFAYYETTGGGAGAGPHGDGASAIHVHMTNTRNTPIEALELALPLRVTRQTVRRGSGGAGRFRGGDGIEREIEALCPCVATLLTERRRSRPPGLAGGKPGAAGVNYVIRAETGNRELLPDKVQIELAPGDRLGMLTAGGGGWGAPATENG